MDKPHTQPGDSPRTLTQGHTVMCFYWIWTEDMV